MTAVCQILCASPRQMRMEVVSIAVAGFPLGQVRPLGQSRLTQFVLYRPMTGEMCFYYTGSLIKWRIVVIYDLYWT